MHFREEEEEEESERGSLSLSPTPIVVVVVVVVFFRNASFVVERRRGEKGLLPLSLLGGCEIHRKKASPEGGEEFHFCSFLGDGYRESEMGFPPPFRANEMLLSKKGFSIDGLSEPSCYPEYYFQRVRGPSFPSCFREAPVARMATRGRRRRNNCCAEITLLRKGRPMQFPAVCAKGKGEEEGFLVFVLFFLLHRFERKLSGFFVVASLCPPPPKPLPFSLHSTSAEG